jgi:hypothetical protein
MDRTSALAVNGWTESVQRCCPATSADRVTLIYEPTLVVSMEPTLTPKLAPYIVAKDARGLISFIERAIGGKLTYELSGPDGKLAHAELRIAPGSLPIHAPPLRR